MSGLHLKGVSIMKEIIKNYDEQMQNDLQSMQNEQTEMLKDWEDAMAYLDSKGVPPGASLIARIIMYKGE